MKANELRIGNYVNYQGRAQKICALNMNSLKIGELAYDDHRETLSNGSIKPIPLTEDWLLKFGFVYEIYDRSNLNIFRFSNLEIHFNKDKVVSVYVGVQRVDNGKTINTLHQLQNLYFALTNKELTQKT